MIKKHKGFYPSWYIKKKSKESFGKINKYLILILIINLIIFPISIKKPKTFLDDKNKTTYKQVNILDELRFLLENNIDNFTIENKILEFEILKNDFKNNIKTLKSKIEIQSIEEIFEEGAYLIKGEFYDK